MNNFCKEVVRKLDEEIKEFSFEEDNIILLSEAVVELILTRIKEIKEYVLEKGFKDIEQVPLEDIEKLEQLRILYAGYKIGVVHSIDTPFPGVDTPEDLEKVRKLFSN